jgi:hypothetical protein
MDKPVASKTFTSELIREGSWGQHDIGKHESTMDLYFNKDDSGFIEWDIPALDDGAEIGLWFDIGVDGTRTLRDYDGIFSLPDEAIELLRSVGVVVTEEYEN